MSVTQLADQGDFEKLQIEVAELIVKALVLDDVTAAEIDFDAPLFG